MYVCVCVCAFFFLSFSLGPKAKSLGKKASPYLAKPGAKKKSGVANRAKKRAANAL